MIPGQIKYDPNATPPQFTDNEDYRIEPGTHIRVKIIGMRSEVGDMWAIGTINEDYLGYVMRAVESGVWMRMCAIMMHILICRFSSYVILCPSILCSANTVHSPLGP